MNHFFEEHGKMVIYIIIALALCGVLFGVVMIQWKSNDSNVAPEGAGTTNAVTQVFDEERDKFPEITQIRETAVGIGENVTAYDFVTADDGYGHSVGTADIKLCEKGSEHRLNPADGKINTGTPGYTLIKYTVKNDKGFETSRTLYLCINSRAS